MQRYFMNQSADENQCFFIENKEDYHHIVNVMRYKEGQNIIVTFSDENVFRCKIISINDQSIEIKLEEKQQINTELPQNITICSGLIKADKYEWMIQKATEMGANEFIAVAMERSVVKLNDSKVEKKLSRWQKIIKEAAEQSYRLTIPNIKFKSNLKEIYGMINQYDYVLIAYEEQAKHGELSQFKQTIKQFKTQDRVLIIFGPEGGLSDSEIALFDDVSTIVGLGPRILRAETAPLYALSAVSYEKELLG
ncbi:MULTISPECIES: 16S rRNA (uracil(1498)-N(3))-methyltransferase [Staphylococcus]|uniref:16S rRNA (uracil(1498)-N(3))-methyltransferase n=1 Tax=Staphylococcus TaxID=1279 RepID=UPI0001F48F03|nr:MULTISPECIES: 16S rRNA (uracil(1498)-N(3))-methyltransferase [Staphylococcus]EFV89132.1 RNA methyltransferase family protein [Staphylococcus epidermidis FRI909]EHS01222.1 RNA methyltransferase, RsmE family [Staphylococcus epidermidis VCU128]EJE15719.1 RNA methyltransferase, RsmE family [Staphylococcus epidermidis NIHLM031]KEI46338.1 16S rRNA methyltransferase [Staphylococcus epidermidis UC7032]KSZ63087.1 16S rRNA methyltransferase [Staphylococcus epidermidis]